MQRRDPPPREYPKTPDDLFADAVREQCAKQMARWLKGSLNLQRPIASMTAAEMQGLAQECISTAVLLQHARMLSEEKPGPRKFQRLRRLLGMPMGNEPPFPAMPVKWWLGG